jgi:hypothetical protein
VRNPSAVDPPKVRTNGIKSLFPAQARAFLDAASVAGDRFEALYVLRPLFQTPAPTRGLARHTWHNLRQTSATLLLAARTPSLSNTARPCQHNHDARALLALDT